MVRSNMLVGVTSLHTSYIICSVTRPHPRALRAVSTLLMTRNRTNHGGNVVTPSYMALEFSVNTKGGGELVLALSVMVLLLGTLLAFGSLILFLARLRLTVWLGRFVSRDGQEDWRVW